MTQKSGWKLPELYLGRALCTSVHSVPPLNPEESPIMSLSCREDDEQTPSTQKTLLKRPWIVPKDTHSPKHKAHPVAGTNGPLGWIQTGAFKQSSVLRDTSRETVYNRPLPLLGRLRSGSGPKKNVTIQAPR